MSSHEVPLWLFLLGPGQVYPENPATLTQGFFFSPAGVIDEDYRGNVGVVLFNFGKEKFEGMLNISNHINVMSFVLNMSK